MSSSTHTYKHEKLTIEHCLNGHTHTPYFVCPEGGWRETLLSFESTRTHTLYIHSPSLFFLGDRFYNIFFQSPFVAPHTNETHFALTGQRKKRSVSSLAGSFIRRTHLFAEYWVAKKRKHKCGQRNGIWCQLYKIKRERRTDSERHALGPEKIWGLILMRRIEIKSRTRRVKSKLVSFSNFWINRCHWLNCRINF